MITMMIGKIGKIGKMGKNKFVVAKINTARDGQSYWYLRKGHFNLFMPNLDMAELFPSRYAAKKEIEKRFGIKEKSNFRVLTVIC